MVREVRMSVNSLTTLAVQRDIEGNPTRRRVKKDTSAAETQQTKYQDVLMHAIPTEILSGYTILVGITVGTIKATTQNPTPHQLVGLRWSFFAGFLLATLAAVWIGYVVKRASSKKRRIPIPEILVATIAAGTWGLVMPGNPLAPKLSAQATTISGSAISIVGAGLVVALSTLLVRPSKAKS
jgi:hypothetical protein